MSSCFDSVQHCNLWSFCGIIYRHDGFHNLPVNDIVLVASILLDVGHGLIHAQDDVDISSVSVAFIDDHYIHGEHLAHITCLDASFHVKDPEVGGPETKLNNLLIRVAVGSIVVRETVLVLIQSARIIPNLCLIMVSASLRRAVL